MQIVYSLGPIAEDTCDFLQFFFAAKKGACENLKKSQHHTCLEESGPLPIITQKLATCISTHYLGIW